MTKQDTYQVLAVLQAFYPDSFRGCTDGAAQMKVTLWQEAFADEPGSAVIAAAKAYASTDTKGFMPTPGQIKEQLRLLQKEDDLSEQDAWDLVLKALRNSSYGAAEEFAKLPEPVKRSVGSQNMLKQWASYDAGDLQFVASEFKKSYRQIVADRSNLDKIPSAVKQIAAGGAERPAGYLNTAAGVYNQSRHT